MESSHRKLLPNPRETANILSKVLLTWTMPIFVAGYKKDLEMEDLHEPLTEDRSTDLGDRLDMYWKQQVKKRKPSLIVAVFKTFWKEYTILSVLFASKDIACRLGQTLLLGQLLLYFRKDSDVPYEHAMLYASGIVILNACNALLMSNSLIMGLHNALKVRTAVCSVIYRKSMRLSHTAFGETAPGKVVNLLSNDVGRFDYASILVNALWTAPLLTIIIGALLWREIGWAGVIGIMIVFVIVPIQSYTSRLASKLRMKIAVRTDERVRFMDEIVSGVQVIKMYAWEKPFAHLIAMSRKSELDFVRKAGYVRALFMSLVLFTTRMAVFCTLLSIVMIYGAHEITASKVFVISSYFTILSLSMSQSFVRGIAEVSEALVAFKRLQAFLLLEEKQDDRRQNGPDDAQNFAKLTMSANVSVALQNVTARWGVARDNTPAHAKKTKNNNANGLIQRNGIPKIAPITLNNLNAELPTGKLIGVIGPVGAGKSSLLQAILRELPTESGSIDVNGTMSYASQEPWVFAGTVRQNILFGLEYERERYDAVIKACSLARDFEQLPNGDRTVIGERGTSLSGGQKARVNLARATYRRADIYLLDDPLSAVDSHVGAHMFGKCIGPKGWLAQTRATRILVTHQVHFLKDADWLIYLKDGEIIAQGTPANLARSGIDFMSSLGSQEKLEDAHESGSRRASRQLSRGVSRQCSTDSDGSVHDDKADASNESAGVQLEESTKGKITGSVTVNYYKAGANWFVLFILLASFVIVQLLASFADYWVAVWASAEESRVIRRNDFATAENSFLSTQTCITVLGSVVMAVLVLALVRSVAFYNIFVSASQTLHDQMFKGIVSTKMRFFDTNTSGRVLNRFSKDMGAVDELVPRFLLDAYQVVLCIVGSIVVTAIVNPIFLAPVACMGIAFVYVRRSYLKTSKSVKRLEGIAKSPVFTHLAATLNGLSTIRAFNAERVLEKEFDLHQDTYTSTWFTFIAITSALGFALDVMCFLFITSIIFIFMLFDTGVSGDKIGLAITQAMALTGILQWGVRNSAEVSNQMMSVERILEYRELEPEPEPERPLEVDANWPANGAIEFQDVVFRYFAEAEPVLRGLSFTIRPKEKIGIVGRTGAGKSSLIGAIFRLACIEGKIKIDGIETSTISLKKLRSSIAIIPQDPVLFSGTLRRNLDPFEEYDDADIWNALEKVELKEIASGSAALGSVVLARGSNFSVGQRQLICLARAILRKNRILVLDEATANVDPQTDILIQRTIREKFSDCTVLTVAHRLHTIIDSDRILVMDAGRAIEFDEAHLLLQNKNGIFSGMVQTLGAHEHRRLAQTALEKYNADHFD